MPGPGTTKYMFPVVSHSLTVLYCCGHSDIFITRFLHFPSCAGGEGLDPVPTQLSDCMKMVKKIPHISAASWIYLLLSWPRSQSPRHQDRNAGPRRRRARGSGDRMTWAPAPTPLQCRFALLVCLRIFRRLLFFLSHNWSFFLSLV